MSNWGGRAAARTSFALQGQASRCKDKLRATRAGADIRASRAPQDFEGGAGGIRNWGGRAAAWTSFALRGLAHIYALRATGVGAYIRASRAPRDFYDV